MSVKMVKSVFGEKIKFLSLKAKGFDEGSPQDPPVKSLSERGFCPPYDHCLLTVWLFKTFV